MNKFKENISSPEFVSGEKASDLILTNFELLLKEHGYIPPFLAHISNGANTISCSLQPRTMRRTDLIEQARELYLKGQSSLVVTGWEALVASDGDRGKRNFSRNIAADGKLEIYTVIFMNDDVLGIGYDPHKLFPKLTLERLSARAGALT